MTIICIFFRSFSRNINTIDPEWRFIECDGLSTSHRLWLISYVWNSAWIRENKIFPAWFREMINFQPKFCNIVWKPKFSSHFVNEWKRKKSAWLGTPLVGPHVGMGASPGQFLRKIADSRANELTNIGLPMYRWIQKSESNILLYFLPQVPLGNFHLFFIIPRCLKFSKRGQNAEEPSCMGRLAAS